MHEYRLPKRGYKYYYLDHLLEQSILFTLVVMTICASPVEFPILYMIFSNMNQWCIPVIQIGFWIMGVLLMAYVQDPLLNKLICPFLTCLSMIIIYYINGSCNSFFIYNMYRFLRNPFQFTFIEDNGYLEINFYWIFFVYICDIIIIINLSNVSLITMLYNVKKLLGCFWIAMCVFLSFKHFISVIISFISLSTVLTYLLIALASFLIGIMIKS